MTGFTIPAVERSIDLRCSADHAFTVFTDRIATWWPLDRHSIAAYLDGRTAVDCVIEGRVGGRVYEVLDGGSQLDWGRVAQWEPGRLLELDWNPSLETRPYTRSRCGSRRPAIAPAGSRSCTMAGRSCPMRRPPASRTPPGGRRRCSCSPPPQKTESQVDVSICGRAGGGRCYNPRAHAAPRSPRLPPQAHRPRRLDRHPRGRRRVHLRRRRRAHAATGTARVRERARRQAPGDRVRHPAHRARPARPARHAPADGGAPGDRAARRRHPGGVPRKEDRLAVRVADGCVRDRAVRARRLHQHPVRRPARRAGQRAARPARRPRARAFRSRSWCRAARSCSSR